MKHLGVLESNLSGSGFDALRVAKRLGCHITFFTAGMERYLRVPGGKRYFDEYVDEISLGETIDYDSVIDRVRAAHARRSFAGFLSLAEYEVVTAAEIAVELGLPGPDPEAVRTARNKASMRRRGAEHRVSMPKFRIVTDAAQAADAAAAVGLPCVVKPADETSGADVRRCTTVAQVVEQFELISANPLNIRGQRRHHEVLVEECLVGFEVSVEVLAAGGQLLVFGVTDKSVAGSDRYVEVAHTFPSLLPSEVRRACEEVALDGVRAVGFDLGMAHVEVRWTADGPKLVEVNPRPAGGKITELVDHGLGISCLEFVVRQYLGEHIDPTEIPTTAARGAAIRYLTAAPGEVTSVSGTEIAAAVPGVLEAVVSVVPGARVNPLWRNEDRVGHVFAVAQTAYLAARTAEAAAHEIVVSTSETASTSGGAQ